MKILTAIVGGILFYLVALWLARRFSILGLLLAVLVVGALLTLQ